MLADQLFDYVGGGGFSLEGYYSIGRDESNKGGKLGFDDPGRGWDG
jgi:hypothetical protein